MARGKPDVMNDYLTALAELRRDQVPLLSVVAGGQEYFRREAIHLYQEAVRRICPGAEEISLQGPASQGEGNLSVATLMDELTSYGLFASNKLVTVRQAQRFLFPSTRGGEEEVTEGKEKSDRRSETLIRYFESPTRGMYLLFEVETLEKRMRLGKTLAKEATVILCPELKYERETMPWLRARAKARGVGLTPQAAEMLFSVHGADPGVLDSELTKLALYVTDTGQIDATAVESFMGGTLALSFFELGNAVEAGDTRKALIIARRMVTQGLQDDRGRRVDLTGTVHMAMGSLRSTMVALWEAHDLALRGGTEADLRSKLGARGWRAGEMLKIGRRLQLRDIHDSFEALASGLASIHDTGSDPAMTLERTVLTLCRRRGQ